MTNKVMGVTRVGGRRAVGAVGGVLRVVVPPALVLVMVVAGWQFGATWARGRGYLKPYLLPTPGEVAAVVRPRAEEAPSWGEISKRAETIYTEGRETQGGRSGVTARAVYGWCWVRGVWTEYEQSSAIWCRLLAATAGTAVGAFLGFALSVAAGTLAAVAMTPSVWVRRAFYPYAVLFQTVPIIAIAPLLVIWLDYGLPVVVATSFIASVFPVVANTLTGLLSTDTALREMFKLYGAGPVATVLKLRLPAALPSMLTGYRVACGLAVIGAIVGEFVSSGGQSSLGAVIDTYRTMLRTDVVFAAVLLASTLGIVMFTLVNALGWLLMRKWHASEQ